MAESAGAHSLACQQEPQFTFLYSPEVGATVEVPPDHEES